MTESERKTSAALAWCERLQLLKNRSDRSTPRVRSTKMKRFLVSHHTAESVAQKGLFSPSSTCPEVRTATESSKPWEFATVWRADLVGRNNCHACQLLEEYYRLKVHDYITAAKASDWSVETGAIRIDENLYRARARLFHVGQALITHLRTCEVCRGSHVA